MKRRRHADSSSMKSKVNPRLLMVLGIAVLLLVGFGAVQVLGGGDDGADASDAAAETATPAEDSGAEAEEPSEGADAPAEQPIDGTPVVADQGAESTDWATQANVICERAAGDLIGQDALTPEAAASALADARAVVDELAALTPPAGAEAEAGEFVALLGGALDAADQLVALGEQGDLEQLGGILQEQAAAQARLTELASVLGVEPCVGGTSAPVEADVVAGDGLDAQAGVAGLLELESALRDNDAVVLVVYSPNAELDTRVVREARAGANGGGAGFVSVNGNREAQIKVLAEAFDLRETPATLVVNRGLVVASRFSGFADRETVAQAVKDALEAS